MKGPVSLNSRLERNKEEEEEEGAGQVGRDVRTVSWTGPPRGKRAPRVGISSTVYMPPYSRRLQRTGVRWGGREMTCGDLKAGPVLGRGSCSIDLAPPPRTLQ